MQFKTRSCEMKFVRKLVYITQTGRQENGQFECPFLERSGSQRVSPRPSCALCVREKGMDASVWDKTTA